MLDMQDDIFLVLVNDFAVRVNDKDRVEKPLGIFRVLCF